jgi:hypothetical protein
MCHTSFVFVKKEREYTQGLMYAHFGKRFICNPKTGRWQGVAGPGFYENPESYQKSLDPQGELNRI